MANRHAFCLAAALLALAGCSSAAPSAVPFPAAGTQINDTGAPRKKVFETLKAGRVVVKVQSCVSGTGVATFAAKGKATGHVRGKFSVSGTWNFFNAGGQSYWTFSESFTIKGKHPKVGTVTGSGTDAIATCKTFGPVNGVKDLTYELGTKSGAATTSLIKNGAAFLQRLH